MSYPLHQADAFTDQPFAGNPAAVCILPSITLNAPCDSPPPITESWMQHVAEEMNLSETAFIQPLPHDPEHDYLIRWFTPAAEVELCGHATLASAHILYETSFHPTNQPIRFKTLHAGQLICSRTPDRLITMDFPADTPQPLAVSELPDGLINHLNTSADNVVAAFKNPWDIIVELKSEQLVKALKPDFTALAVYAQRGISVTALADPNSSYDFVSRFFAPRLRINEDPVTGSLHCVLGPYWANKFNKHDLIAYQASKRGGYLHLQLQHPRIQIAGHAKTIFSASLHT